MVYQCHALQGRAHEGRRPPDPTPHRGDRGLGANTPDQWVSGSLERPVPGRQAQGTRLWPDHHDSHRDLPARWQTRLLETQPACRALTHLEFNRAIFVMIEAIGSIALRSLMNAVDAAEKKDEELVLFSLIETKEHMHKMVRIFGETV